MESNCEKSSDDDYDDNEVAKGHGGIAVLQCTTPQPIDNLQSVNFELKNIPFKSLLDAVVDGICKLKINPRLL